MFQHPNPYECLQPGRNWNSDQYRFGFNGKENDNEVKGTGNSVDFGARIYDSRLGHWLSLDPLQAKFPEYSPYSAMNNSPIMLYDPDGRDSRVSVTKNDNGGGTIVISTTVQLYGKNAEASAASAQQAWSNIDNESTYTDEEGNSWTVRFELEFKVNHELEELDPDRKGLSYNTNTSKVEGVQKGDNFVCTDCLPAPGHLEDAAFGGSSTISPAASSILHGVFHNIGFDDQYSDPKEIMYGKTTGKYPENIGQERFDAAAEYILNDLENGEGFPSYEPDENGTINVTFSNEQFER